MTNKNPPRLPLRLLKWFCRSDYLIDVEGDLWELYQRRVTDVGQRKARWLLYKDVLLLFRPGMIRPIMTTYNQLIYPSMFRHNLLITYRSFLRNKSSFLINLIGLSTGLASVFLIYLWVNDELSVDKFHEKDDHLYQVMENLEFDTGIATLSETSGRMAAYLREEMPQVKYVTAVGPATWPGFDSFTLSVGERTLKAAGQFAGKDFFNIFSFELIAGNIDQVLSDKNAIVLSEALAMNLFGTTEGIINKVVEFQHERQFVVSGVFKETPKNSSMKFDFVLTFETLKDMQPWVDNWGSTGPLVYLILKEGTNIQQFNREFGQVIKTLSDWESIRVPFVKRYSDNYLYGTYENGVQTGGRIEYVRLFSFVAVFILLIACINFMNLSTAKASKKLTEIGVKKVVGAQKKSLVFQFIGESMVMAFTSLILATLIVMLFLPQFNQITGKQLALNFDSFLILSALAITFLTGIISGSYPALYLSSFKPISILKGGLHASSGEVWARKGLVIFQFAISIILIVSVWIVHRQIGFIQRQNLGFDKENVIWFNMEGKLKEDTDAFLKEVRNIPGVVDAAATAHSMVGHNWSIGGMEWEGSIPDNQIMFQVAGVDYEFIETIGVEILEGRSFSRDYGAEREKIIFNEAAIEAMGLENPIGKTVNFFMGEKEIIGVAKNFHFKSFHNEIEPLFFILSPDGLNKVMVKIKAGSEKEVIAELGDFYETFNSGFAFDYRFLDDTYQAQYDAEKRISALSYYFSGVAIIISCLGLFGLAAFSSERRIKEIGIRKILGSSIWGIVSLLTTDFTKMVLIGILIALPVGYLLMQSWLGGFAYKIQLQWWYFAGAAGLALLIAWFTVALQTFKVAFINPAECLRNE